MDVLAAAVNICGPFVVRAASVRTTLDMDMVREARVNGNGVSINWGMIVLVMTSLLLATRQLLTDSLVCGIPGSLLCSSTF